MFWSNIPFKRFINQCVSLLLLMAFLINTIIPAWAQSMPQKALAVPSLFIPATISGLTVHPKNLLEIDFLVDRGDNHLQGEELRRESEKLVQYFMAALTVPEDQMWVNLSPTEKDRIIADGLGRTALGRDMLAMDLELKKVAAGLMGSLLEKKAGSKKEEERSKSNEVGQLNKNDFENLLSTISSRFTLPSSDFLSKIWIVPDKAVVFVKGNNVFVAESHLKVKFQDDFLAISNKLQAVSEVKIAHQDTAYNLLLTTIEQEINTSAQFAPLRQIYHAMILATWYKKKLKASVNATILDSYIDQNLTNGIDLADKNIKDKIYNQYLAAFQEGVVQSVKEEYDPQTQTIIAKKYLTGGLKGVDSALLGEVEPNQQWVDQNSRREFAMVSTKVELDLVTRDGAMLVEDENVDQLDPNKAMDITWIREQLRIFDNINSSKIVLSNPIKDLTKISNIVQGLHVELSMVETQRLKNKDKKYLPNQKKNADFIKGQIAEAGRLFGYILSIVVDAYDISMRTLARESGVNLTTLSRVSNGFITPSEKTIKEVTSALEEMSRYKKPKLVVKSINRLKSVRIRKKIFQDIGKEVFRRRMRREWTQAELARKASVNLATIQNLELGLPASISEKSIRSIVNAFGVFKDDFMSSIEGLIQGEWLLDEEYAQMQKYAREKIKLKYIEAKKRKAVIKKDKVDPNSIRKVLSGRIKLSASNIELWADIFGYTLEELWPHEDLVRFQFQENEGMTAQQEPRTPPHILRGLKSVLISFERYYKQAKILGRLTPQADKILEREIAFRRDFIQEIEKAGKLDRFFAEVSAQQPASMAFSIELFEEAWENLTTRNVGLKGITVFSEKIDAMLADDQAKRELTNILLKPVAETEPDRYFVEDMIINQQLKGVPRSERLALDRAVSTGVTSIGLQENIGGKVIAADIQEAPLAHVTPLMLVRNIIKLPEVHHSGNVEFRRGPDHNSVTAYYPDIQGKVSVVRDAAYLLRLVDDDERKVVGSVFSYAQGNPRGLIYHQSRGTKTNPNLFSQLIFKITGPNSSSWELLHAGYLYQNGGKDRSLKFADAELLKGEQSIGEAVVSIRKAMLRKAELKFGKDIYDQYGRLSKEARQKLINEIFGEGATSEEVDILKHIAEDILAISPWTREAEYHRNYYQEKGVYARHDLAWDFVEIKYDLKVLLDNLEMMVDKDSAMLSNEEAWEIFRKNPLIDNKLASGKLDVGNAVLVHENDNFSVYLNKDTGDFWKTTRSKVDLLISEVTNISYLNSKFVEGVPELVEVGEDEGVFWVKLKGIKNSESLSLVNTKYSTRGKLDLLIKFAQILRNIHNTNLVHSDIKPNNLVVNSQGEAMIIDFGFSVFNDSKRKGSSFMFSSPESIASSRMDVYSFGVLILDLMLDVENAVEFVDSGLDSLIDEMIDINVKNRPNDQEVIDRLNSAKAYFKVDSAMIAQSSQPGKTAQDLGGIDLNASKLDLKEQGSTLRFEGPDNLPVVKPGAVNRVWPVITNIVPVSNVRLLLGADASQAMPDKLTMMN